MSDAVETITLTWRDMPHSFVMQQRAHRALAALKVKKKKGRQRIPVSLPQDVTVETILASWKAQGNDWDEIVLAEGSPFIAVRVIWLPKGSIVWFVLHLNDRPVDGCSFTHLTKRQWAKTGLKKLTLAAVAA